MQEGREVKERRQEGTRHMNKSFSSPFQKQGTEENQIGMEPMLSGEMSDLVFGLYCFHQQVTKVLLCCGV